MIRDGKDEGWLRLPIHALQPWAAFNDVTFNGIIIGPQEGREDRGSTIIAHHALQSKDSTPLLVVPKELILSLERVQGHAKYDRDFREVLDAPGDFGRVSHVLHQIP